LPPTYYRGCWHVVSRDLFPRYRHYSSLGKEVYNPKAFFPHAALLRQAFAHCAKFLAAASRRSRGRVSVPVWLDVLSNQLPVIGLVSRYPTNYLIGRKPLLKRPKALVMETYLHYHMRYYSTFRRIIPRLRTGYLRVTQPFATIHLSTNRSTCMHKARR
jgi:hypothetical protein